jgi:hypothetical protein
MFRRNVLWSIFTFGYYLVNKPTKMDPENLTKYLTMEFIIIANAAKPNYQAHFGPCVSKAQRFHFWKLFGL